MLMLVFIADFYFIYFMYIVPLTFYLENIFA